MSYPTVTRPKRSGWGYNPATARKKILKCDFCGVLFARPRGNVKAAAAAGLQHEFCSQACSGLFRGKL
jgi:hypothetical protein